MYMSYYRLTAMPFARNADPPFRWIGKKQQRSLAALRLGILEEQGFLLLSGDPGTGKTTLCRVLTEGFDHTVLWATIADPRLERLDFYNAIAAGFDCGGPFTSKVEFLLQIGQFLQQAGDAGKRVLLLIDDCHEISQELLEELRLLVNIGNDQDKLLNILLVGRQELNHLLEQPRNRVMYQRLIVKEEIMPLTSTETEEYLHHRLHAAGAVEKLFTDKAIRAIYTLSGGVPQRIDTLGEQAMKVGAGRKSALIDLDVVLACARTLGLSDDLVDVGDTGWPNGPGGGAARIEAGASPPAGTNNHRGLLRNTGRNFAALAGLLLFLGGYFWLDGGLLSRQAGENPVAPLLEKGAEVTVAPQEKSRAREEVVSPPVVPVEVENEPPPRQEQSAPAISLLTAGRTKTRFEPKPEAAVQVAPVGSALPASLPGVSLEPRRMILSVLSDDINLTWAATRELNGFIDKLQEYPRATLLLKGFVSSPSNSPENIQLSYDRALAVKELLVARGIAAERITVQGMGNLEPLASNATALGRRQNRRVELEVLSDGL